MRGNADRLARLLVHRQFASDLARRLVGDPHAAEDVAQQAWLRALRSPPPDDRALRGWISRVVLNVARSRYRVEERRARVERLAGVPEAVAGDRDLEAAELRERLERALARIGERHRESLRLRYYEGLPPREIARRLGVPLETVHTRLQRGLRALRRELAQHVGADMPSHERSSPRRLADS